MAYRGVILLQVLNYGNSGSNKYVKITDYFVHMWQGKRGRYFGDRVDEGQVINLDVYSPILTSDRKQRRVDRLLDQIEQKVDQKNWQRVRRWPWVWLGYCRTGSRAPCKTSSTSWWTGLTTLSTSSTGPRPPVGYRRPAGIRSHPHPDAPTLSVPGGRAASRNHIQRARLFPGTSSQPLSLQINWRVAARAVAGHGGAAAGAPAGTVDDLGIRLSRGVGAILNHLTRSKPGRKKGILLVDTLDGDFTFWQCLKVSDAGVSWLTAAPDSKGSDGT